MKKTLLVFGDSLSAAYGLLDVKKGWVSLLSERINQNYPSWQVVNLSVSGETTTGSVNRLPDILMKYKPNLILLELGANDGLQGRSLEIPASNLKKMIEMSHNYNARVLLFEMKIPVNYGPIYTTRFNQLYHTLAKEKSVVLVPFLLQGIAGNPKLNQADGIHPIASTQPLVLSNVWKYIEKVIHQINKTP